MASQDNPIFSVINEKLGLDDGPKSFQEKVGILRSSLISQGIAKEPEVQAAEDVLRKAGKAAQLGGFAEYTGKESGNKLFERLSNAGLVPNSSQTAFGKMAAEGSLLYKDRSLLFFPSSGIAEQLPLFGPKGEGTFIGGKLRKSAPILGLSTLTEPGGQFGKGVTYTEEFYSRAGQIFGTEESRFRPFDAIKQGVESAGLALESGITQRGIYRPEESFFTASRPFIAPQSFGINTSLAEQYRAGINVLTKTAGSLRGTALALGEQEFKTVGEAFTRLNLRREQFFRQVAETFRQSEAGASSYVFVKPDFIGGSKAMKIADPVLTRMYGSQFEEHTLSKGLRQLAKSDLSPTATAPFAIRGMEDFTSKIRTGMRVAVVETATQAQYLSMFGEGGAFLTEPGKQKLARRVGAGSVNISGPDLKTIKSVEELFGINLGSSSTQVFDDPRALTSLDPRRIGARTARLKRASRGQGGFIDALVSDYGDEVGLSKVELTDTGLRLDFATRQRVTPETVEMLIAARRHSAVSPSGSHPLSSAMSSRYLRDIGVDVVMSADEFAKTLGPEVFLANFVDQVSKRQDAARIFSDVFGHRGWERGQQVLFEDYDSAFNSAMSAVKKGGYLRKVKGGASLIKAIEEGEELSLGQLGINEKAGVTGVRVFGMTGAVRTDFMGDINMMKPLRMTASKMVTLGSGYKSLGYGSPYEDPLIQLLKGSSRDWRGKSANFQLDEVTGRLKIGKNNLIRKFAEILSGTAALSPTDKARFSGPTAVLGKDGLYLDGKKLNLLPDLKQFAFSEGGLPLTQLDGTLLDPNRQMVYLDLGKEIELNVGGSTRKLQKLPIPVGLLRKDRGPYDRVVMGKKDPAYEFIEAVRELEQSLDFDPSQKGMASATSRIAKTAGKGYENVIRTLLGKEGLLEETSSILLYGGTRARLAPSKTNFFMPDGRVSTEKMLTAEVTEAELYDFFKRKSTAPGVQKQFSYLEEAVKRGEKDIFVMLSADPAQRAEHFQVMKLHITGKGQASRVTQKLGQLNVSVSPMWLKLMERDLDRDVVNFLPLSGMNVEGRTPEEIQKVLAERYEKEKKLMKHYVHLYGAELEQAAGEKLSERTLGGKLRIALREGKRKLKDLGKLLTGYEGGQKSLGYTIVRSGEDLMVTLAGRVSSLKTEEGIGGALSKAMSELGMEGVDLETSMLRSSMFSQFVGEEGARRISASRQALQALYQGAVQKAGAKEGLEELGQLVSEIGERVSKKTFNYAEDLEALNKNITSIIEAQSESGKLRAFRDLPFLAEQNQSLSKVLDDLSRGAADASQVAAAKKGIIADQAKLISEFLLPGIVARRTMGSGNVEIAEDLVRGKVRPDEDVFGTLLKGLGIKTTGGVEEATSIVEEAGKSAQANKTAFGSFLDFMTSSRGKAFAGGIGVGVLAATAVRSMVSDEAPMPRDIDVRQPMDQGPDVFTSSPRVYGSSSPMHASRGRNPVSPTSIDGYSMYSSPSPHISISDKRSAFDPHLIDSHMRAVANSDYTY